MSSSTIRLLISLFLIVVFAYLGKSWFFPGEREQILGHLEELQELARLDQALAPLEAATRVRQSKKFFSENFQFRWKDGEQERVISGWENIRQGLLWGSRQVTLLQLSSSKHDVIITPGRASVDLRLHAEGVAEGEFRELLEVSLNFVEESGNWKIQEISAERMTPQ